MGNRAVDHGLRSGESLCWVAHVFRYGGRPQDHHSGWWSGDTAIWKSCGARSKLKSSTSASLSAKHSVPDERKTDFQVTSRSKATLLKSRMSELDPSSSVKG